jgi:hypothetical protein
MAYYHAAATSHPALIPPGHHLSTTDGTGKQYTGYPTTNTMPTWQHPTAAMMYPARSSPAMMAIAPMMSAAGTAMNWSHPQAAFAGQYAPQPYPPTMMMDPSAVYSSNPPSSSSQLAPGGFSQDGTLRSSRVMVPQPGQIAQYKATASSYRVPTMYQAAPVAALPIINQRIPASQAASSSSSQSYRSPSRKRVPKEEVDAPGGLGGERRLSITFTSLGKVETPKQHFGKHGWIIPDGLAGTHTMYSQDWKFQIVHKDMMGVRVISWIIISGSSGTTTIVTETPEQAMIRQTKGNTICNQVLRQALEQRAIELEKVVARGEKSIVQIANIKSLIKELRPKQCTEGLLFFGLRHACVQLRDQPQQIVAPLSKSKRPRVARTAVIAKTSTDEISEAKSSLTSSLSNGRVADEQATEGDSANEEDEVRVAVTAETVVIVTPPKTDTDLQVNEVLQDAVNTTDGINAEPSCSIAVEASIEK